MSLSDALFLIDGNNHVVSDWHALENHGDPRNSSKITVRRIAAMVERWKPGQLVMCWDGPDCFRKKLCPEYKANREAKPEALVWALTEARDYFEWVGVPSLKVDGFEGDDIIATLAMRHKGRVVISSGDKDCRQLLEEGRVVILRKFNSSFENGREPVWYSRKDLLGEIGAIPFTDYQAICGDTTDNIRGADGFGSVKAKQLLEQYGSLQELMARDEWEIGGKVLSPKLTENLRQFRARWRVVYELVTLRRDVPVPDGEFNCPESVPIRFDRQAVA